MPLSGLVLRTMVPDPLFLLFLAILAPFAFAALVLPATRSWWTKWWGQLVQWSIIGIPISFFLYLSGHAISAKMPAVAGIDIDQTIVAVFAPMSALLLLFIGIMLSVQMAPTGASKVIDFGRKWERRGRVAAGSAVWRRMGRPLENLGVKLRERGERVGQVPLSAGRARRAASRVGRIRGVDKSLGVGTRFLARWAGKGIEMGSRQITTAMQERDDREMEVARARNLNQDPNDIINRLNSAALRRDWNGYVGAFSAVSKDNGDSDEIRDAFGNGKLKKENFATAYKHAENHGNPRFYRNFLKAFPDMAEDGTLDVRDGEKERIWEKFDASDIRNETTDIHSKAIFGDPTDADRPNAWKKIMQNIFLKSNSNVATEAMRHQKRYVRDAVVKYAEELGEDWFIENHREDTLTSILSAGGRTMGVPVFSGLQREQIQEKVAKVRGSETDEMLRDRRSVLELQLSELPRGQQRKQGPPIQAKIDEIASELELRDTTANPTANLVTSINDLASTIDALNRRPIGGLSAQDYRNIATTNQNLSRNQDELQRRRNLGIP